MHDVFPKFIVEGDNLIIAKCTFHKQLVTDESKVKGGGLWNWDKERREFKLYGESTDYGYASEEDVKACIKSGNVYFSYIGGKQITDHTFYLNTGIETIQLNNL